MSNKNIFSSKKAFGGVVSTLIMFIAIVGLSTAIVVSFQQYIADTQSSIKVQNEVSSNKLKTILSITNIYYNSSSQDLHLYVKNIGETKLYTKTFDLFIDNQYYSDFDVVHADNLSLNKTLIQPQETMVVIKNTPLTAGSHDVKVVSEYGVGDEDSFNI